MESIMDGAAKVLIDPWNQEFSTPKKCLASLVTTILFPTLIFHLASAAWRYTRDIKKNDTQDAISEKISALVQKIFPSTTTSSFISVDDLGNKKLKDILKKENLTQLRLYSKEPLSKEAELPIFAQLQEPITVVKKIGDDDKTETFMAFKILADVHMKEDSSWKLTERLVMYIEVGEDCIYSVRPIKSEQLVVTGVDEDDLPALLDAIIYDAKFTQEDDTFSVSYRLSSK